MSHTIIQIVCLKFIVVRHDASCDSLSFYFLYKLQSSKKVPHNSDSINVDGDRQVALSSSKVFLTPI